MLRRIWSHPSHAKVVAYLGLFVALGGTSAYAANTVFSEDIVNGEVKSVDIANGSILRDDLANLSVTDNKLTGNAVTRSKIVDGAVNGSKVADKSIGALELKDRITNVGETVEIPAGGTTGLAGNEPDVRAQCPQGMIALNGGAYWHFPSGTISGLNNYGSGIVVQGTNRGQAAQKLSVFAHCLPG